MRSSKKNISLVVLLFLVAVPVLFSVYTIVAKLMIEESMEERMEAENLQVISMDEAAVVWLKKNKELLVNGEPFDVKTITKNGNKLIISGLFDTQEKELKKQLQDHTDAENNSAATNNSLLLLFFTAYYQPNEIINLNSPFLILKKQSDHFQQDKTCSSFQDILIPPPRLS